MIDDCSRSPAGCCYATACKGIDGPIFLRLLKVHVRVRINTARTHIHAICIKYLISFMILYGTGCTNKGNRIIFYHEIRLKMFARKTKHAILY